jgi:hypothetical protein
MLGILSLISGEMVGRDPLQSVWNSACSQNGIQICVELRLGRLAVETRGRSINVVDFNFRLIFH